MAFHVVILAAGQGSRMCSTRSKVLHTLAGRPLISHVLATAQQLETTDIHVVIPPGHTLLEELLTREGAKTVYQQQALGTGHGVAQALVHIPDEARVLVLYADTPLINLTTLTQLLACSCSHDLTILTACVANPFGYGRILREHERVIGIVEECDASEQEKALKEVNTGILHTYARPLKQWLKQLQTNNNQGEFYLTDIVAIANAQGASVGSWITEQPEDIQGVNTRTQLAALERVYQQKRVDELLQQGVSVADPSRVDIRGSLVCGQDVFVDINVIFTGDNEIGNHVLIGPGCLIKDCHIADGAVIEAYSILEKANIGEEAVIGPFARIRANTTVAKRAKVGNFVEIKNTHLGESSKASHLTYLGDSHIGKNCNIGAGVITCNYDGANKHPTDIENDVFVGSGVQIVAPCKIGAGATVAAGTTVTKDIASGQLSLSRVPQRQISGWQRPKKTSNSDP